MSGSLPDLLDWLDRLQEPAPLANLRNRLERLRLERSDFATFLRFSEKTYARNLVRSGPWYSMLVLCWRNGQRSPIHDHRGSACAVRVLDGTMTESFFVFAPNGHVKPMLSRDVERDKVVASEDMDVHQVSNLQAGLQDLITLHIYSPPLLVMGTYNLTDDRRGEEAMLLEFQDAAGI
jgi:cysteine dioxygenase